MSSIDELKKLLELKEKGGITEEEYQNLKAEILRNGSFGDQGFSSTIEGISPNTWGIFIHISQLLGFGIPLLGFIVPFLIWQFKKNESPIINEHGINAVNWMISEIIYLCVFGFFSIFIIGYPFLFAAIAMGFIFPIVASLKASNGEVWKYPFSFKFIKNK